MNSSTIVLTGMPDNVYKNIDYNKIEGSLPFPRITTYYLQ